MENPPIQIPLDRPEELTREGRPSPERPDPDNPPWGVWGALGLLLLSFGLMLVTQVVFLVPYALRRGVKLDALGEFITKDAGAIFVAVVSIPPAHLITLAVAWLLVTRVGRYPFLRTLGWEWGRGLSFWRCVWLALLLLGTGYAIIYVAGECDNELERILRSSRSAALAAAFAATFTAPVVEEVVFRGLLYPALRRLVGVGWAVAVVFVIFAAIHVPQYWPCYGVIGTILLLSLVLTVVRARTGRLLPCVLIHFVFNGVQCALLVLAPYLEGFLPKETPPPPAPGLLFELCIKLFGAAW
ncbi:MAG TPA: type II CAAX endopeptidase family protein [Pyrinomonadaceae bacterium]|nr:type II CAAX endopeptidase family protein [Pyrinomonadaceae bacterium]